MNSRKGSEEYGPHSQRKKRLDARVSSEPGDDKVSPLASTCAEEKKS